MSSNKIDNCKLFARYEINRQKWTKLKGNKKKKKGKRKKKGKKKVEKKAQKSRKNEEEEALNKSRA